MSQRAVTVFTMAERIQQVLIKTRRAATALAAAATLSAVGPAIAHADPDTARFDALYLHLLDASKVPTSVTGDTNLTLQMGRGLAKALSEVPVDKVAGACQKANIDPYDTKMLILDAVTAYRPELLPAVGDYYDHHPVAGSPSHRPPPSRITIA